MTKKFMKLGFVLGIVAIIGASDAPTFLARFQYPFLLSYVGYVLDQFLLWFKTRKDVAIKNKIILKKTLIHGLIALILFGVNIYCEKIYMDKYINQLKLRGEAMEKYPKLFFNK